MEEYIEFSIARKITACEGNFLFNKHPRRLHISAQDNTQDPIADIYFELNANEKIKIKKESILAVKEIEPCTDIQLTTQTTQQFADWLAARYNRPALPTAFERRFNAQWNKNKREKALAKVNESILGIYVDINPDAELENDLSPYEVQLLLLISPTIEENANIMSDIKQLADKFSETMTQANMNVVSSLIKTEKQVSIASFKSYRRLFLDSLSYKSGLPTPPTFW